MRRPLAILTSAVLLGVSTVALGGAGSPASGQVDHKDADYKGYSTGTVVHADAARLGTTTVADVEVAFSGASVASKGTGALPGRGPGAAAGMIVNEMDQVVQPALPAAGLPGDRSYGRGSALEVGALTPVPNPLNTLLLAGKAEASAPPSTDLVDKSITVPVNPVAYASLLRGQAQALWGNDNCLLGGPLSLGRGFASDVQLLNTGAVLPGGTFENPLVATNAPSPERAVSQSQSVTRIVPQTNKAGEKIGDNFGLMSETRMTIAPITLFKGTPNPVTVELLGEWVLRSVATGLPGQAYVFFGTTERENSTPIIRVLQGATPTTTFEVTLQTVLQLGLQPVLQQVSGVLNGVVPGTEIVVGESPRSVEQAADGTLASAAIDIVRVKVADPAASPLAALGVTSALDVRVGHMEARAQVPAGGIRCQLPVQKTSDKQEVNAGDSFTYTIKVDNPFADCELTNVRIEDTITVESGVRHSVTGTSPTADSVSNSRIIYNDIGPIPPRSSKTVSISVAVAPDSGSGLFTDNAKATGNCATGTAQGTAKISIPAAGEVTVVVPRANGAGVSPAARNTPAELPRTGGDATMPMVGLVLLAAAAAARRFSVSVSR